MPAGGLATAALISGGAALVPSIFKTIKGIGQTKKANSMNPIDPGYMVNQSVIDNAANLSNRASNYLIPNYGGAVNNIYGTAAQNFARGVQGASSSGDVLSLAQGIAYGQNKAFNNLAEQNTVGAERAYMQGIDAQNMAGRELQAKNEWEREQYMQKLREKAALTQSGAENTFSGLSGITNVTSSALLGGAGGSSTGSSTVNANPMGSIFSSGGSQDEYYRYLMNNWDSKLNRPTVNYTRSF